MVIVIPAAVKAVEKVDELVGIISKEFAKCILDFFNGGVEDPNVDEFRLLVNSPKDVPTYDLKPEMSAPEVGMD